jgi:hypothetical protein
MMVGVNLTKIHYKYLGKYHNMQLPYANKKRIRVSVILC